jgi:Fe-S-cluster-containing dehydrogenase component/CRP-like cAMP-binding protein
MPREIKNHEQIIDAFRKVEIVSELVEQRPNGEFKNELDMDIIVFGRSYRGKKVGPYTRFLEFQPNEIIIEENTWESTIFYVLVEGKLEALITDDKSGAAKKVGEVSEGSSFGEMAILSGTRRRATVKVADGKDAAFVLEFTRPALRLLRKLPQFGKALDRNYRSYGLDLTLNEFSKFSNNKLSQEQMDRLGNAGRFAVYEKNHVLFHEGDPINRIVFIRSGWIQRVSGADYNPNVADELLLAGKDIGLDLLGAGSFLGLEGINRSKDWEYTATVKARAEVVEFSIPYIRADEELRLGVVSSIKNFSDAAYTVKPPPPEDKRTLTSTNKIIETGVVDSVNLLIMDMAKCIRCGNCSLACHKVHGHSRLMRRGIHIERPVKPNSRATQHVLMPSVCLHCQDPECLTGCPTGAIARFPGGEIDIEPKTCIGCGDCATQCPYNAITMIPLVEKVEKPGTLARLSKFFSLGETKLPEPVTDTENLLAVKCNLCQGTGLNPPGAKREAYSCEENCPTGALLRVNPREYFSEVKNMVGLIYKDQTHAIGKNIHQFDFWARFWHIFGSFLIVFGGGFALWATRAFTQDIPLIEESWVTMRWLTGLSGLAGIIWVMAYPLRKQVYRRRAVALRYWLLSHIYIGVLAGFLLLVHGGTSSGGLLTSLLMLSFDLTIASGIFGALCYVIVPRLMTRIEGEPLLIEDLEERREELKTKLFELSENLENQDLRNLIRGRVRRKFLGFGYLLHQFIYKEDLKTMLAKAREEFRSESENMSRIDSLRLAEAVESAATLRHVDALCYLHYLLKLWLPPHVLFTSIMLILLVAHIIQVVFFNVR